jgi:lysophospholipase L1-like esterase
MHWIKKTLFFLVGITISASLSVLLLELIFGEWLGNDEWRDAENLNIIRSQQIEYPVGHLYGNDNAFVTYTRDVYGLRDSCERPADIDILTLGGSTTDQRYIGDGDTFQDVLQDRLTGALGRSVCISNAAVDGHSTFGHIASFEQWFPLIPGLRPDYVLFYVGINDAGFRDGPRLAFDVNRGVGESTLRYHLRDKSAIYSLARTIYHVLTGYSESREYAAHQSSPPSASEYVVTRMTTGADVLIKENTQGFSERIRLLIAESRKMGATPVCVSQPHLFARQFADGLKGTARAFDYRGTTYNGLDYHASISALNSAMNAICTESGGAYIDLAGKTFETTDFYDAVHMTPTGAARVGKYLFEDIKSLELLE